MRLKLFMLMLLSATMSVIAQTATIQGTVVNATNGNPVSGAQVTLRSQNKSVDTGFSGNFRLMGAAPGSDYLVVTVDGFESYSSEINPQGGQTLSLGEIRLTPVESGEIYYGDSEDMMFDESVMEDEEGNSQSIAALTGANDNLYYNTASYNFGPMYFRYRGYDSQYQSVSINGITFNDLMRGRFNYSSLLGMTSRAFRNKTTTIGINAANYSFGDIGGSVNYNTTTDTYAPGFNGSLAFTNSNYLFRAMATYSTGMSKKGWALTVSGITRYSSEGVQDGTFYKSAGLFLSLEKKLDAHNSLTLTAFGGPTQRATGTAVVQEAYDLAGSNLYNPNWGWQDGKKRSKSIRESFDPTAILSWIYKKDNTFINTAAAVRWVNYNSTDLNYYKGNDPKPVYYKNLPSYYEDQPQLFDLYTDMWENNTDNIRQIQWDNLYQINYLNNLSNQGLPQEQHVGSTYIMENRHSNQFNAIFNSYINQRLSKHLSLQGGLSFNYTNASYYKTVRDLMGGEYWLDVDPFSDRDVTIALDNLQNDLNNPNRRVGKGDRFGYDYNIYGVQATAWLQNVITLPHWDVFYGMKVGFTQYQRNGNMRNGRAPNNSYGMGSIHRFDNSAIKAGATFKINGRNYVSLNGEYGTRAPLAENIYISPRISDKAIENPQSERILSADAAYVWNYRRFRGTISAFYTAISNAVERTAFYDESFNGFVNFVLSDVKRVYAGYELGLAYKLTPSVTLTFAGTVARYQYKSNPQGTRSFENGLKPDTVQTVYYKNRYLGSVPQSVCNIGIDWAAPKSWFFNINGTWQGDAYVNMSPSHFEAIPALWDSMTSPTPEKLEAKIKEISHQEKLKDAFSLNISIGKLVYINRKISLNFNLNINNVLNNRNVVTYAYQQGRLDTKNYDPNTYPVKYQYAQGVRVFLNVGVRF